MAKLTIEDRGRYTLSFLFESAPLTSNYVTISYFKNGNEFVDAFEEAVEVGTDVRFDINLSGLDAGTEYLVYVFDAQNNLLASATEATLGDKPIFKNYTIKSEKGKINVSFSISGLNSSKNIGNLTYDSNVSLRINGEKVETWPGKDIDIDDKTGNVPRGTLNVTREYDFPSEESCVVRIEAFNVCANTITGTEVYYEETFREKIVFFPFAWELPKVVGERIRLGANEWNGFIGKIKNKLSQKGISYSKEFTTAVSAGFVGRNVGTSADGLSIDSPKVISKKILCEAVDALNAMLPADEKISYPTGIAVDFLNNIVDKLNSI